MLIAADVFIVLAWCDLFQDNIYSYTSEISRQIISSSQPSRQKYIKVHHHSFPCFKWCWISPNWRVRKTWNLTRTSSFFFFFLMTGRVSRFGKMPNTCFSTVCQSSPMLYVLSIFDWKQTCRWFVTQKIFTANRNMHVHSKGVQLLERGGNTILKYKIRKFLQRELRWCCTWSAVLEMDEMLPWGEIPRERFAASGTSVKEKNMHKFSNYALFYCKKLVCYEDCERSGKEEL